MAMTSERNPMSPAAAEGGDRPGGEHSGGDRFWDEATLVAYVDGELDAAASRRVEALLTQDAGARAKVELMRKSARALRGAYDEAMSAPLPASLAALVAEKRRQGGAAAHADAKVAAWRRRTPTHERPGFVWRWLPLAASLLLLAIGFAGGIAWRDIGTSSSLKLASGTGGDPAGPAYETALAALLDGGSVGSSRPYADAADGIAGQVTLVGDFTAKGGMACREFRHERTQAGAAAMTEAGIACRRADGGWEVLTLPTGRSG
jgi:hypothetical protein